MDNSLFGVENLDVILVLGLLIGFGVMEAIFGFLASTKRKSGDWIQEAGGFFALSVIIKPLMVATVFLVGSMFFSGSQYMLASWGLVLATCFYLFIDDLMQYWYHRSAHEYQFLWKLHRAHHQAEEMGFFISYRNAGLYYFLMPNLWWVGICTFMGLGKGVALGLILKQVVIITSHSTLSYDKAFYKSKWLSPIISVLERIIITPSFHHSHHGKSMIDSVSDPNGNFGNMFSIWDQVFGTAKFTKEFPKEYGLVNDPKEHWTTSYLYPLVTTDDPNSEMHRGYVKKSTITNLPIEVKLEKGEKYLYCQCGKSKNAPFCDGNHQGSKIKPLLIEATRTGTARLCNCKKTGTSPFCDDTHLKLVSKVEKAKVIV